jgi:hypothetical protein
MFELYALSKTLELPPEATRAQILDAMKDIIVGKASYVGRPLDLRRTCRAWGTCP